MDTVLQYEGNECLAFAVFHATPEQLVADP